MTVGPQLGIAVPHPEVAGLALVLAGGAGRDGFEPRPVDVTGRDVPARCDAGLDEQHGPVTHRQRDDRYDVVSPGSPADPAGVISWPVQWAADQVRPR